MAMAVTRPSLVTMATVVFEDVHVTVLFVALLGYTTTVSGLVSPSVSVMDDTLRVMEVTSTTLSCTVTVHVALMLPILAVIVALPFDLAVITPLDTVATDVFEDVHDTVLSVASVGLTVAVNVKVCPTSSDREV
jgi:hypothetical protein